MPPTVDTAWPGARSGRRDLLRRVAEGTAGAVGDEFLRCLVRHVALAFDAKFAFVAEATDPRGEHVRVLSGFYEDDWMDEPFEYDTLGTPCELIVERSVVAFPEALKEHFPEAKPAIDMGLASYLAICLRAADATHLGHMAVMDAGPMAADDEDLDAMRIFASRAAAELERRHQADALRRSRARVIEAADAERRRVGRDLHDGAQQRLVSLALNLGMARKQLGGDGGEAGQLLDASREELDRALAELRELAHGIYPAALSDRGLDPAIEALAGRAPFPVDVRSVPKGRLPEHVEQAAYFVVSEALTNVAKHASATQAQVTLTRADGQLTIEIGDDGVGGADLDRGSGLRGLADRVAALEGQLDVESTSGAGTRVRAEIPYSG